MSLTPCYRAMLLSHSRMTLHPDLACEKKNGILISTDFLVEQSEIWALFFPFSKLELFK